jgi:two-component system response regulator PilR (NtrC family)
VTRAPPPEPTLLVVDDEESVAMTLAAVLAADGYRVETARSVDEALARIAETAFTAAVLDLNLDTGDGLTVLARLKESSPETVAVALTGYASLGSARGRRPARPAGYRGKPVDNDEL